MSRAAGPRQEKPNGLGVRGNVIAKALHRHYGVLALVGIFSGVVNVLALTGSFYMLQVYDRVLTSHSVPTLVGLSVLMILLYLAYGLIDFFRVRIMSRIGMAFDREIASKAFAIVQLLPLRSSGGLDSRQPIRDLDAIRSFLSSLGPTALFDMPWVPVYLGVVFLLHPVLGLFALAGATFLVILTMLTELRSSDPMRKAAQSGSERAALAETARRNAEAIRALGMAGRIGQRWQAVNSRFVDDQTAAADAISGIGSLSKILRLLLQSGILGLGAYFVLKNEVSPGAIIAASITMSRALAPIETAIAHWRGFVAARQSYHRLVDLFASLARDEQARVALPAPTRSLAVSTLYVTPPGASSPVLLNVDFKLQAGEGLGVIGPTASGKSSLARALVGVWMPSHPASAIRLDGATLDQWSPDALGRHIGYVPQEIELIEGTVAENIARFDPDARDDEIVAAAQAAFCHDMIVRLPDGYQTRVGSGGGQALSGGQRQRIALARALFRDPFLVVLDEPNSNLDIEGDAALAQALLSVRRRGGIVVIIAHKAAALAAVDRVMALANGQVQMIGPRDEVLRKVIQPIAARREPASGPQASAPMSGAPQSASVHTGASQAAGMPSAPAFSPAASGGPPSGFAASAAATRGSVSTSSFAVQDLPGLVVVSDSEPRGKA